MVTHHPNQLSAGHSLLQLMPPSFILSTLHPFSHFSFFLHPFPLLDSLLILGAVGYGGTHIEQ
jgi:hypothetical protein